MDTVVIELLKLGWQGAVVALVLLIGRAAAPALASVLPAWVGARGKREDRLMEALEAATRVMAETVAALQCLRGEVVEIRRDQGDLRADVAHIAHELDLPRPRRRRGGFKMEVDGGS